MTEDSREKLGELSGKLSQFIDNHNSDMKRIYDSLKENEEYLRTEVRKALNGQTVINTRVTIIEMEQKNQEKSIGELDSKILELSKVTERNGFFFRNPDIEKGNKIYGFIKFVGWVIMGATAILVFLEKLLS